MTPTPLPLSGQARFAAVAARIVAVAVPPLLLVSWVAGRAGDSVATSLGLSSLASIHPGLVAVAAGVGFLPALAMSVALFRAADCFDRFATGDWFDTRQPRALAAAGRWLAISGMLGLIVPTVAGLILSIDLPAGQRVLALSLSSSALISLLFGALLWRLGRLWAVARELALENAAFV